jgi:CRP-like cAMP-binding protein
MKVLRYEAGEVIFREGDHGRNFFIILEGDIEVVKEFEEGVETVVATIGAGKSFGEISL